jgi:translation initiation factor RLI1
VLRSGNVGEVLDSKDERGQNAQLLKDLDLEQVLDRNVENLSGGLAVQAARRCMRLHKLQHLCCCSAILHCGCALPIC